MTQHSQNGEGVEAGLRNLLTNFEDIAAMHPNDQPHYKGGARQWGRGDLIDIIATLQGAIKFLARESATADVGREVLTPAQLDAIISALTFCLAGEWDESSHDHAPAVYERALAKVQSLNGRVLKGSLRVALDECNQAFHASDSIAKNAERRCTELKARVTELEAALSRAAPSSEPAIAEGER